MTPRDRAFIRAIKLRVDDLNGIIKSAAESGLTVRLGMEFIDTVPWHNQINVVSVNRVEEKIVGVGR